ncbi:MAG: hypothetical protein ACLFST_00250 [Spirochaetia bacterium]
MNQNDYNRKVNENAKVYLNDIAQGGCSLWTIHAFMENGITEEEIRKVLDKQLASKNGGPFDVLPAMLFYFRWREVLPDFAGEIIRDYMETAQLERGNTENHWLMYYTGNLLAAEAWPGMKTMWNGLTPEDMHSQAKRWILGMMDRSVMVGHHEYDSTSYMPEHMVPTMGLHQFSRDPEVREKAEKMLLLFFTDMSLEYFKGAFAGSHAREGYRQNTWTKAGPVRGIHFLYYLEDYDSAEHKTGFVTPLAVMDYRPPVAVIEAAHNREEAHVVKKTKAPRNIYRHPVQPAGPVYKYTYMSKSFALGTAQLNLPEPGGPIDLVSWDLTWEGPKHHAKIVCNHPYISPKRFSAFLSDLPQLAGRNIGTGKPYLQYPDRLFGASPYEAMMQHKGTAIITYRIPETDENPFINMYLPKSLEWEYENGWFTAQAGTFYVSFYIHGAFRWEEIIESVSSNIMVRGGDLIDGWLLRIHDPQGALIIDAAEAADFSGFREFADARSRRSPDFTRWKKQAVVETETVAGDKLRFEHGGNHWVNSEIVRYQDWPLYGSPWVNAGLGSGILSYTLPGYTQKLDFGIDPAAPLQPMRSIG